MKEKNVHSATRAIFSMSAFWVSLLSWILASKTFHFFHTLTSDVIVVEVVAFGFN
jgi:hypothetical protein